MTTDAPAKSMLHRASAFYLCLLGLLLAGYALVGKGIAYLGIAPLFVGELMLAAGLVLAIITPGSRKTLVPLPAGLLAALMALGGVRTIWDFDRWGIMALRDGATWGYGFFAFIVAALLMSSPRRFLAVLSGYGIFARWYPLAMFPLWMIQLSIYDSLPRTPGSMFAIIHMKGGDILVHLCGSVAFLATGLCAPAGILYEILFVVFVGILFVGRGGFLAWIAGMTVLACLGNGSRTLRRTAALGFAGVLFLAVTGMTIRVPSTVREISMDQLVENIRSLVAQSEKDNLSGTREWRTEWWRRISLDTLQGRYFWVGQGFGINLADAYGYHDGDTEDSLRSPHNIHVTYMARLGIPGVMLWVALQAAWIARIYSDYRHARARGLRRWAGLFVFLLAYWIPFLVNGSFDVFLEGPMGGIWLWCIFGAGLAASCLYRQCPQLLIDYDPELTAPT